MTTHYVGDDCPGGHQDEGGAPMTDPERMTADELEALADRVRNASSYLDREDARAVLEDAAPVLARRLARLLRAVEMVLADWEDEQGWCRFCGGAFDEHEYDCLVVILRGALEAEE